ncbi:MAG: hypothetical protein B7X07_01840 [Actinobacteria bacterium 21-64-8]|nr:MAG: hypothetical protein B7X07_01840 [Actinobacteria bacterium 21-64-8]
MGTTSSAVLSELLGDDLSSDPTTNHGLTNHLPMALVAKQRLGASDGELVRFARRYARRLVPLDAARDALDESTWRRVIGRRDASAELRPYFARRVMDEGVDHTLRQHLPLLWPGLAGAGFHGAIRLAYALEASSPMQVAAGLAYWTSVAEPLGALPRVTSSRTDPMEILREQSASRAWSTPVRARLIDEELRLVAHRDGFDAVVSAWGAPGDAWAQLHSAALAIYAATNNFTALHGVTGLAALSTLRPWMEDEVLVSRYAFQALAAAYFSIGAPRLWSSDRVEEFISAPAPGLDEVRRRASMSDDEHVAKIVYTSLENFATTADPLYAAVATRAVHDDTLRATREP